MLSDPKASFKELAHEALGIYFVLKRANLKVPSHATRCACDSPLQASFENDHKWACPPRCVLYRSVYQPTQWTVWVTSLIYLSHIYPSHISMDTPTCDVIKARFSKRLVTANHTHT